MIRGHLGHLDYTWIDKNEKRDEHDIAGDFNRTATCGPSHGLKRTTFLL